MNEQRIDDILDRVCRLSGGTKDGADRPTPETIFTHEPELLDDPNGLRRIILEDFEARAALGEGPSVASYLDRFEKLVPDLKPILELNAALNLLSVEELRDA